MTKFFLNIVIGICWIALILIGIVGLVLMTIPLIVAAIVIALALPWAIVAFMCQEWKDADKLDERVNKAKEKVRQQATKIS